MSKEVTLLSCTGERKPGPGFTQEYQKAVLLALWESGKLERELLIRCIEKLETEKNCG